MTTERFHVWEGIYPSYADAPESGPGFASDFWVDRVRERIEAQLALSEDEIGRVRERNMLPLVVAMAAAASGGRVRVLDFGGGPGNDFLGVARPLPTSV